MTKVQASIKALSRIPEEAVEKALKAGAQAVVKAQRQTASQMLKGPYATGETSASVEAGKVNYTKDGHSIYVYPKGNRNNRKSPGEKPKRAAEVAFLNEYGVGKRHMAPRPFIRTANAKCEEECIDRMQKAIDEYADKA